MLVFISSIIFYNLTYTTQVWIGNFRTCAMQANICNAHSNATYKFMSLLPLLVSSNFNWSTYNVISFVCSPIFTIFVNYFCPFVINDHKRWAQILDRLGWNHVMWGSFFQIGSIYITCKRYLSRFDPRASFFTPPSEGYHAPYWVKHL
jgi:hypothetical protein